MLAKEWERARAHLDEWNGQAIKTDTEKWRRKENGGSRVRGNRIFPGYSREIEIGSWRRETERIYWQRELRETREKPLADSLARVESKSGEERECRRQGTDFPIVVLSISVPEIQQHLWFLLFRVRSNFDFFMHHSFHTFVIQFYAGRAKEKLSGSCRNDEVRNK